MGIPSNTYIYLQLKLYIIYIYINLLLHIKIIEYDNILLINDRN